MTVPSYRDVALMLVFSVGMPLAAGGWWRYYSGYDHPAELAVVVEQAPAAEAAREANERETQTHLLAWTTSAVSQDSPAGPTQVRPGEGETEER